MNTRSRYRNQILPVVVVALAVIGLTGCAEAPTADIEMADQALEQARAAEAGEYAPDSLKAAEDARAQLDTELKAQEERLALVRSYDKAKELAAAAQAASDQAEQDAVAAKNVARDEAAALIAEVRTKVTEVQELLAKAPRGKGTEVDLAALKSDLTGIETALTEIDGTFAAGEYLDAKTRAQAAKESLGRIESDILGAMEAVKKPAAKRS
ncbi:MAG TPA: hypothetical protein VFG08_01145 [Candidatus Polarisedimenticolia bacterium]|nr:hypothetical protein [Candidatus Polarisedimenticolia bacterium]